MHCSILTVYFSRVEDQASWVDDCPTNNMDMERLMGKADYRLQKLQTLPAASRSIVLQKTRALREASKGPSFRSFRKVVEMKREKEVEWNASVKEKFSTDAEKKQEVALGQERKRLTKLEDLKTCGGPFTNAEEVEQYLGDATITNKEKQRRMKKEVQFARESSTTLPKVDLIFKIQVIHPLTLILNFPFPFLLPLFSFSLAPCSLLIAAYSLLLAPCSLLLAPSSLFLHLGDWGQQEKEGQDCSGVW